MQIASHRSRYAFLFALAALACPACGADGSPPPGEPSPDALSVELTPFTLQPGEEVLYCEYLPADGVERWVRRFSAEMSEGSHHLLAYRIDESVGRPELGLTSCTNLEQPPGFDGLLPGSKQRDTNFEFPEGVAMKLGANHGVYFQMHYVNTTSAPLTARVRWTAEATPAADVKETAGLLFYSNTSLNIPPLQKSSSSMTCKSPRDMHIVTATGHMHKHGISFDADLAGDVFYHTDSWEEPSNRVFQVPGYDVKAGADITWTCGYDNDTSGELHFGGTAADEMCIFVGTFYPSADSSTDFGCLE